MLKIWGRISSSNVQAVMWCITELGLESERIDAGLTYGVSDTADYLDKNPNGTVPMLQDGKQSPLWESGAILRYLCNQYAPDEFWPRDPQQRAHVDRWAEWAKINVALNFTGPIFWQMVRTPEERRDLIAVENGIKKLEHFLKIANAQLANQPFLAGDVFTLADIQFAHCLYRYFDIEIARHPLPNLARYYQSILGRPAYQEHVIVSYEELINTK